MALVPSCRTFTHLVGTQRSLIQQQNHGTAQPPASLKQIMEGMTLLFLIGVVIGWQGSDMKKMVVRWLKATLATDSSLARPCNNRAAFSSHVRRTARRDNRARVFKTGSQHVSAQNNNNTKTHPKTKNNQKPFSSSQTRTVNKFKCSACEKVSLLVSVAGAYQKKK